MSRPTSKDSREWISFDDPEEERTWLFDVSFLESSWTCIFGSGCHGIDAEPDLTSHRGCCSHGAYLSDDADRARVLAATEELTEKNWQLMSRVPEPNSAIYQDDDGSWRTVIHDGACIFLNRPEFTDGPGCALHKAAIDAGVPIVDTKPEVCWQVPIRREDHETETGHLFTMVREWARRDWGDGGDDFGWWCTDSAEAHVGGQAVYVSLKHELTALCGPVIYGWLRDTLDSRAKAGSTSTHPIHLELPTRRSASRG